jgi:hypothetical protein
MYVAVTVSLLFCTSIWFILAATLLFCFTNNFPIYCHYYWLFCIIHIEVLLFSSEFSSMFCRCTSALPNRCFFKSWKFQAINRHAFAEFMVYIEPSKFNTCKVSSCLTRSMDLLRWEYFTYAILSLDGLVLTNCLDLPALHQCVLHKQAMLYTILQFCTKNSMIWANLKGVLVETIV